MKKMILILVSLCLIYPSVIQAETNTSNVKVAFTRDGYLWTKINDIEERLTDKKATLPFPPQWSHDGEMLLYQKEGPALIGEQRNTKRIVGL